MFFQKYFKSFIIASSKEDLKTKIIQITREKSMKISPILPEMIKDYLGYFDGNALDRVVNIIKEELNKNKNNIHLTMKSL